MEKILFAIICAVVSLAATAQENKITVNAVEVYGEIGDHWESGEGQFWKGYYWDGA